MEFCCISKGERRHLAAHFVLSKVCWAVMLIALCCVQIKMFGSSSIELSEYVHRAYVCDCCSKVKASLNGKKRERKKEICH